METVNHNRIHHKPVWLIGFMGSGKTTVGKLLAGRLGWRFTDSDGHIEQQTGMTIAELFAEKGEAVFRELEKEFTRSVSAEKQVIACGGGLPCFYDLMDHLLASGIVVYLKASPEILSERLKSETSVRPLLRKISPEDLPVTIRERLTQRTSVYQRAHIVIDVDAKSPEKIVEELVLLL